MGRSAPDFADMPDIDWFPVAHSSLMQLRATDGELSELTGPGVDKIPDSICVLPVHRR